MPRLTAIVLGSAAGGGVPQWNCFCPVCRLAWEGDPRVKPRTQTGLAVSGEGTNWILLNASPDLRAQIAATPKLRPQAGPRASPIAAVILSGAEIDQVSGLLHLREGQRFALYGTPETLGILGDNPVFEALAPEKVSRYPVRAGEAFSPSGGLEAELFLVPGKAPLYLEGDRPDIGTESGTNVGIEIRGNGGRLVFVPGAARLTPLILERLKQADVLLFDGTFYQDNEMIDVGVGNKTGRRMGHVPIEGAGGSLSALARLSGRRIYIHFNNTNRVLMEDSHERRHVEAAGFEVAYDGMEIVL